jgi:hypothetical protein
MYEENEEGELQERSGIQGNEEQSREQEEEQDTHLDQSGELPASDSPRDSQGEQSLFIQQQSDPPTTNQDFDDLAFSLYPASEPPSPSEMQDPHADTPRPAGLREDLSSYITVMREFQLAHKQQDMSTLNLTQDERAFLRWRKFGERYFGDDWRTNRHARCLLEHPSDDDEEMEEGLTDLADQMDTDQPIATQASLPQSTPGRNHMFDGKQRRRFAQQGYQLPRPFVNYTGLFTWAQKDGVFNFLLANHGESFSRVSLRNALTIIPGDTENGGKLAFALINGDYFVEDDSVKHSGRVLLGRYVHLRLLDLPKHPAFGEHLAYDPVEYRRGRAADPSINIAGERIFDYSRWTESQDIANLISWGPTSFCDGRFRVINPTGAAVATATTPEYPELAQHPAYNNDLALERIPVEMRDAQAPAGSYDLPSLEPDNWEHRNEDDPGFRSDSQDDDIQIPRIWPEDLPRNLITVRELIPAHVSRWRTTTQLCTRLILHEHTTMDEDVTRLLRMRSRCKRDLDALRQGEATWHTEEFRACRETKEERAPAMRRANETDETFTKRQLDAVRHVVNQKNGASREPFPPELIHLFNDGTDQRFAQDDQALSYSVFRNLGSVGAQAHLTGQARADELAAIRHCEGSLTEQGQLPTNFSSGDRHDIFEVVMEYQMARMSGGATDLAGFSSWPVSDLMKHHVAIRSSALAIRAVLDDELLPKSLQHYRDITTRLRREYANARNPGPPQPSSAKDQGNTPRQSETRRPAQATPEQSRTSSSLSRVNPTPAAKVSRAKQSQTAAGPAVSAHPKQPPSATTPHHDTFNFDSIDNDQLANLASPAKPNTGAAPGLAAPDPFPPSLIEPAPDSATSAPAQNIVSMPRGKAEGEPRLRSDGTAFNTRYDHTRSVGSVIRPIKGQVFNHAIQTEMVTHDVFMSPINQFRRPPPNCKVTDSQMLELLLLCHKHKKIAPTRLHEDYPADFNSKGYPEAGRRQKGLPGVMYRSSTKSYHYVCFMDAYLLIGGGHLEKIYASADKAGKLALDNINAPNNLYAWCTPTDVAKSYNTATGDLFRLVDEPAVDTSAFAWQKLVDKDRFDPESEAFLQTLNPNQYPAELDELLKGHQRPLTQLWGARRNTKEYMSGVTPEAFQTLLRLMPLSVHCYPPGMEPEAQIPSNMRVDPLPYVIPTTSERPVKSQASQAATKAPPTPSETPLTSLYPEDTTFEDCDDEHPSAAFGDLSCSLLTQGTFAHTVNIDAALQNKNAADDMIALAVQHEKMALSCRSSAARLMAQAGGHVRAADAVKNFTVTAIASSARAHALLANPVLPKLSAVQPAHTRMVTGFSGDSAADMNQFQTASTDIQMRVLQQSYTTVDDSDLAPAVASRITMNTNAAVSAFASAEAPLRNNVATTHADHSFAQSASATEEPAKVVKKRRLRGVALHVTAGGSPVPGATPETPKIDDFDELPALGGSSLGKRKGSHPE